MRFWTNILRVAPPTCPRFEDKELDMYRVFKVVVLLGGFHEVTGAQMWSAIADLLGLPSSGDSGWALKLHYEQTLLPYERFTYNFPEPAGSYVMPPFATTGPLAAPYTVLNGAPPASSTPSSTPASCGPAPHPAPGGACGAQLAAGRGGSEASEGTSALARMLQEAVAAASALEAAAPPAPHRPDPDLRPARESPRPAPHPATWSAAPASCGGAGPRREAETEAGAAVAAAFGLPAAVIKDPAALAAVFNAAAAAQQAAGPSASGGGSCASTPVTSPAASLAAARAASALLGSAAALRAEALRAGPLEALPAAAVEAGAGEGRRAKRKASTADTRKHAAWRTCPRCEKQVSINGYNWQYHARRCDPDFFAGELAQWEEVKRLRESRHQAERAGAQGGAPPGMRSPGPGGLRYDAASAPSPSGHSTPRNSAPATPALGPAPGEASALLPALAPLPAAASGASPPALPPIFPHVHPPAALRAGGPPGGAPCGGAAGGGPSMLQYGQLAAKFRYIVWGLCEAAGLPVPALADPSVPAEAPPGGWREEGPPMDPARFDEKQFLGSVLARLQPRLAPS
eukprot:tig00000944_g5938.t1